MASVEKPIESAQDIDQVEVVKVRRQAPEDADIEAFEEAQNTSWGDVARSCFCHSVEGWSKIFFGIGVVCFILYWFLIALELLGTSAKCLTGCLAGDLFGEANPVASVIIGMLATVLLQSSSTATSIIVSLVGSGLSVETGIYMVMGANIGTSVTNTIVAMGQMGNGDELERAFAGATVHDMFNFLTVIILLPVEVATHYLYHLTKAITPDSVEKGQKWSSPFKIMLDPIVDNMILANKKLIANVASGEKTCDDFYPVYCANNTESYETCDPGLIACNKKSGTCPLFFQNGASQADDMASAGVNLFIALVILSLSLICLVTVLKKMLLNTSKQIIFKATSFNGYFSIIIGALLTILVQSSSVTTSTLTPLVGIGVIPLYQMYPLTLGANIGTTVTGLMAAGVSGKVNALQVALAHLFFNITGILIFYPIPFMRRIPIGLARMLGRCTRVWRGFPIIYIAICFFVVPLIIWGISELLATKEIGTFAFGVVLCILVCLLVAFLLFSWFKNDGKKKFLAYFAKKQRTNEALQKLPANMEYCLEEIQNLKRNVGMIDLETEEEVGLVTDKALETERTEVSMD